MDGAFFISFCYLFEIWRLPYSSELNIGSFPHKNKMDFSLTSDISEIHL